MKTRTDETSTQNLVIKIKLPNNKKVEIEKIEIQEYISDGKYFAFNLLMIAS